MDLNGGNLRELDVKHTPVVLVIHPSSQVRIDLRSLLERKGCTVATDPTCSDSLTDGSALTPDLILLSRRLLEAEGVNVLARFTRKWNEVESVFLPEGLDQAGTPGVFADQILGVVDRILKMPPTRELLAF
jgi:hypothetical protein